MPEDEPYVLHLQRLPNGNRPEPDLDGEFFAGLQDEAVEDQLDVGMEEWAAGKEDEETMMWNKFDLP